MERVKDRKRTTFFKLIKRWVRRGTTIRHKKKIGGGFSKIVKMEDGTELNVNTNKYEGPWAHLKQDEKNLWNKYKID